jgi:hypothetical protein
MKAQISSDMKSRKLYNSLTPIKKGRKKLGEFIVFDIESNNWKEYVIGGIYDGESFKTYDTIKGLCDAINKFKNKKVYAHFGGIFDFLFLINHWGYEKILESSLIMRGSSIFSFTMGTNIFYDSSGILPFSLDRAAKAFRVDHQKLDIDHSIKKRITKSLITYLEHDCKALHEVITKFYQAPILENTNFKPTLASQSLEVLRKYIPVPIPSINSPEIDHFIRRAYAGGRVEIFRPIYDSADTPLNYYDFASLYPSVMRDMDVPGHLKGIHKKITPLSYTDCEVESPDGLYLPLLWQKTKTKFIFPEGKFRGVFPGAELIEAEKLGYKIHKIHKSIEFTNLGPIFRDYIDDLFKIKSEATDPVQREVAKYLLNAGYGRMGIKRERETLCIDDGSPGITPLDIYIGNLRLGKKETHFDGFSHPGIAALVTAHARIKLHRAMVPVQDKLYYCDTDSIITSAVLPNSQRLGQLKLEDTANQACFLLPKTYIFGSQCKMKGFPKEFAQSQNFEDFKLAMEGDLRLMKTAMPGKLARIKSTKNHGSILKVLNNSVRQLRSTYDKRILYQEKNGVWNSRPINAVKGAI